MSLLLRGGIRRLSELEIDVDKSWQAKGITNLQEVAAAMAKGDVAVRGDTVLVKITPGPPGHLLTSAGPGHLPVWAPPVGPLERWIAAAIELTQAVQKVTAGASCGKNAALAIGRAQAYSDTPADYIRRLDKTIALADAEAIVTADKTRNQNSPLASQCAIQFAVGGAVLDDGGVQTDYATEINNAIANDVPLLPAAPLQVDDAFYFGLGQVWDQLWLNIGVAGVGNYVLAHEYWNGTTWAALSGVIDNTSEFTVAGKNNIYWTRPGDWALTTVLGINLYWIRARVTAVVSYTTQPLSTQGWCEVLV
jgi:hypothetical protein